jgi:hypothetical protein
MDSLAQNTHNQAIYTRVLTYSRQEIVFNIRTVTTSLSSLAPRRGNNANVYAYRLCYCADSPAGEVAACSRRLLLLRRNIFLLFVLHFYLVSHINGRTFTNLGCWRTGLCAKHDTGSSDRKSRGAEENWRLRTSTVRTLHQIHGGRVIHKRGKINMYNISSQNPKRREHSKCLKTKTD